MKNFKQYMKDGTRIAMAYVGTVIGAGFASGQEIRQFFTRFGYNSYWAILLSTIFFIFIGKRILLLGYRLNAKSFRAIIQHIFGVASPLVNIYLSVSFILLCGAMYAGGGALFAEHWGLPFWLGAILTAIPTLAVTIYGVRGILTVNTILVPSIILFSLIIFIYVVYLGLTPAVSLRVRAAELFPLIKTGVTYASFNLILCIGIMAPMGGAIKDIRALYTGSIMGGGILGLLLLVGNYALLGYIPEVFHKEIPFLFIVKDMGKVFIWMYGLIIWFGIFTTAISNLFAVTAIINETYKTKVYIAAILVTIMGLLICALGFSNIIAWFYPVLGIIGFILIGVILIHT